MELCISCVVGFADRIRAWSASQCYSIYVVHTASIRALLDRSKIDRNAIIYAGAEL